MADTYWSDIINKMDAEKATASANIQKVVGPEAAAEAFRNSRLSTSKTTPMANARGVVRKIDNDTYAVGNQSSRATGFDTPEVTHVLPGNIIQPGQDQGASDLIYKGLAENNFKLKGSKGKDTYLRSLPNIVDNSNQTAATWVTKNLLAPVSDQTNINDFNAQELERAKAKSFPGYREANPYLDAGLKAEENRIKDLFDQGYKVTSVPKYTYRSTEELSNARNTYGNKALGEARKDYEFYSKLSEDTRLGSDDRNNYKQKAEDARKAMFIAANSSDKMFNKNIVTQSSEDRFDTNQSKNQITDSFISGLRGTGLWAAGQFEQFGDDYKIDYLSKTGRRAAFNIKKDMGAAPETHQSLTEAMNGSNSLWGKLSSASQVVANSLASSTPAVATLAAGGLIGAGAKAALGLDAFASAVAGGTLPTLLFSGKNYEAQPEGKKDSSLALATGFFEYAAEKFGLDHLLGSGGSIYRVADRDKIVKGIVDKGLQAGKVISRGEALKELEQLTKKELVKLADFADDWTKKQYFSKEAIKNGAINFSANAAIQGGTEGLQQYSEMLGQMGAGAGLADPARQRDFTKQMVDSVGAGIGFAGTFYGPKAAFDTMHWHAIHSGTKDYERQLAEAQQYQALNAERVANKSGFESVEELTDQLKVHTEKTSSDDLYKLPAARGLVNTLKEAIKDPLTLFRQNAMGISKNGLFGDNSIINDDGSFKEYLTQIMSIFNGQYLPGASASRYKQNLIGRFIPFNSDTIAGSLKVSKQELNDILTDARVNYWSKKQDLPTDTLDLELNKRNDLLNNWRDNELAIQESMKNLAIQYGVPTGELTNDNAFMESSIVHKDALIKNKVNFIDELVKSGASHSEATQAYNNLLSNDPNRVADARAFVSNKGLINNPTLSNVFQQDILASSEAIKEHYAGAIRDAKYFGKNGSNLALLLRKAYDNNEFGPKGTKEADTAYKQAVGRTQIAYEIHTGNYHRGKENTYWAKAQAYVATGTMLASLPKAAISSISEIFTALLGTPADKIIPQLQANVTNFVGEIKGDLNRLAPLGNMLMGISAMRRVPNTELQHKLDSIVDKENELQKKLQDALDRGSKGQDVSKDIKRIDAEREALNAEVSKEMLNNKIDLANLYQNLGYNDSGYSAASKFEYGDGVHHRMMSIFARTIALRAQTDANRMSVLSVASDILMSHLRTLLMVPKDKRSVAFTSGRGLSKEQAMALTELQQYGMDVNAFLLALENKPNEDFFRMDYMVNNSDSQYSKLAEQVQTILANFVDSKITNPQPHNMPKYMYDPRLRLITLMQRFVVAQTAVLIPRLYKQYLISGHAGMAYSAFFTIASSYLAASLGNALKDQLSYGEESPYIKGKAKKFQRNIYGSGVLGRMENIVDKFSPLYPQKTPAITEHPLDFTYEKAKDLSPQVGWLAKTGEGTKMVLEGKTNEGLNKAARALPVLGGFPQMTKMLVNAMVPKDKGK